MKKNSLFTILAASAAVIGMALPAHAQNYSPYWSLAGNSNANSSYSKLGTTNGVSLRIVTNNSTRAYIDRYTGNVSIGYGSSTSSSYRLYVTGSTSGIYGKGSSSSGYGVYGQGGKYGVYGSGSTYGVYGDSYSYYGIYGNSYNGYGGYCYSYNGTGLYGNTPYGYYGVYGNSGKDDGYGVVGYCGDYVGVYGLGYWGTYGYSESGYGASGYSPGSGIGVYGSSEDNYGGYFASTNENGLYASTQASGYYAAYFEGDVYSTGSFVPSDRRLKKNIESVSDAMSIIRKLQPKRYEYKNDDAKLAVLHMPVGRHYGLIAQDLKQVLPGLVHEQQVNIPVKPELVKPKSPDGKDVSQSQKPAASAKAESMDIMAVNYEELIPIMIEAMKEQDQKIEALTQQLNALTASRQSEMSNGSSTAIKLSNSDWKITPNPASSNASIRFSSLPVNSRSMLSVTDNTGKTLRQIQLSNNSGVVDLDISSLTNGTYTCTLSIDGILVGSKTMQVTR